MTHSNHIQPFVAATALAFCAFTSSGKSVGAEDVKPDADAKIKTLEEHVKQLEKRITDLEADAARPPRAMQTPGNRLGFRSDDFNSMLEQLRKHMMENNDSQFGFGIPGIPNVGPNVGPNGGAMHRGGKPTLGVGVDEVSDELKTRFKNDIKEGAFVMSVHPNSPAEKAGVAVGDAITAFDDKPVTSPKALIDTVKAAAKGWHDILVSRHGELLKFKVELGAPETTQNDLLTNPGDGNVVSHTELKVSALELPDDLSKQMKLDDAQKTKVSGILSKYAKELSEEFARTQTKQNAFGFTMNGDISALAKKHADLAAKDLAGVLNDEQMKKWNEYRNSNSSISFSQSTQLGQQQFRAPRAPKGPSGMTEEEKDSFKF